MCFIVVEEYDKSILSSSGNAPKSLSIQGEHGHYAEVLYVRVQSRLQIRQKNFSMHNNCTWRIRLKNKSLRRICQEYLSYMENTPIDIKSSLSRRIFGQIPNSDPKSLS